MEQKDTRTTGTYTYTVNNVVAATRSVTNGSDTCSPGPIIRGDGFRPTPWSYRTAYSDAVSATFEKPGPPKVVYSGDFGCAASHAGLWAQLETACTRQMVNTRKIASSKFYDRIGSGLDLGTSAAEQYADGVSKPARDIVSLTYESVGREDPYKGRRHASRSIHGRVHSINDQASSGRKLLRFAKRGGKIWLLNAFVIQPLLSDLFNAAIQLQKGACGSDNGFRVFSQQSDAHKWSSTRVRTGPLDYPNMCYGTFTGTLSTRIRYEAYFRLNPAYSQLYNLTTTDPLVLGWNVIPFSFLVDYVYNIGGWLENLEKASRYQSALQAHLSYFTETTLFTGRYQWEAKFNGFTGTSVGGKFNYRKLDRKMLTVLPAVVKPQINVDLGSTQLLNVAGLLAQTFK